jgi:hypothetical protein
MFSSSSWLKNFNSVFSFARRFFKCSFLILSSANFSSRKSIEYFESFFQTSALLSLKILFIERVAETYIPNKVFTPGDVRPDLFIDDRRDRKREVSSTQA